VSATPCPVCGDDGHGEYLKDLDARLASIEARLDSEDERRRREAGRIDPVVAAVAGGRAAIRAMAEAKMNDKGETACKSVYMAGVERIAAREAAGCKSWCGTAHYPSVLEGNEIFHWSGDARGWCSERCRDAAKRPTPPTFEQLVERVGDLPTGQLVTPDSAEAPCQTIVDGTWKSIDMQRDGSTRYEGVDGRRVTVHAEEPAPAQAQPSGACGARDEFSPRVCDLPPHGSGVPHDDSTMPTGTVNRTPSPTWGRRDAQEQARFSGGAAGGALSDDALSLSELLRPFVDGRVPLASLDLHALREKVSGLEARIVDDRERCARLVINWLRATGLDADHLVAAIRNGKEPPK